MDTTEMLEAQDTILELMSNLSDEHRAMAFSAMLEAWCPQCGKDADTCPCMTDFRDID